MSRPAKTFSYPCNCRVFNDTICCGGITGCVHAAALALGFLQMEGANGHGERRHLQVGGIKLVRSACGWMYRTEYFEAPGAAVEVLTALSSVLLDMIVESALPAVDRLFRV